MPKKVSKWKKTAKGRKISKSLKRHHAAARHIQAREPGLTYREAQERVKETFIKTIIRSGGRAMQRWIKVGPGQYQRIEKGKPVKRIFAYGPKVESWRLNLSMRLYSYWDLVYHLSDQLGLSVQKTREFMTGMREAMEASYRRDPTGKRKTLRARDIAAIIEHTDRYPNVRLRYGV